MLIKTSGKCVVAALLLLAFPIFSSAQVDISVNFAPPALPVYDQPPIPEDGYMWTPGYWAWGDDIQDYYWVPGTWVPAPQPDYLWTPGYWEADGGAFFFHRGYWGPHVGFYGGVNYGYGYGGEGYEGGYWQGGRMYYNRSVNNISTTNVTNVYNTTVINNVTATRTSYNGGVGGVRAQPSAADQQAARDQHLAATAAQSQHLQAARSNPGLRASQNHGRPAIAATARAAIFTGPGVVQASRGGTVHPYPQAHAAPGQPTSRPEARMWAPRPPVEEQRAPAERAPARPPAERAPPPRAPAELAPAPRPPIERAPEAPPRSSAPPPRAEPRPAERAPQREENREH